MEPEDDIWRACKLVWRELDSTLICQGFILMYQIAEKVIAHKGTKKLLQTHDSHSVVCNSFSNTPYGVNPKDNVLDLLLYMNF